MFTEFDRRAMTRALALAERGLETTQPNPRVGCVIAHGEEVVGEGWHERAGEPHAEINALHVAGPKAVGATAYVTLEPCSHHGRTPPCVDALIAARVARAIFALEDPNPRVGGRGAEALRRAGVVVESGLLAAEAAELNPGFLKRMRSGRPWVRVKLAMSLDGRTALANGASQWITGPEAREDVQHWRARSSAILTGIGTVLADDPRLDVRLPDPPSGRQRLQPLRVVLDARLQTPPGARMLTGGGPVLIMTSANHGESEVELAGRRAQILQRGAAIEEVPVSESSAAAGVGTARLSLPEILDRLGRREINELWVEAGARLAGRLLDESLADELVLYMAPRLLGPNARALADIADVQQLSAARRFAIIETRQIGQDLRIRLRGGGSAANDTKMGG
ncbi:MAG TPA: bifunctional diaminohydroxyphosphoribosylaminopyrimidine deaminase/5-amino-6-(5-phosphoribosylamino)uracil reductase RibD [Steroidobacteraceae bacterium]|jgi:diaminohydroxyphosphoribosylaminopyrimidine deaminase/5-amino-6-(5-phosphoribosylamino)uracil reductase|nr:bifunctional diaminohydroxyphosphoribosylaminopyrimidine deaminase/5-amino-6-(5-phosphoribosylamino)uracil reductase RibD [Steroidobacteraceae bacterium]